MNFEALETRTFLSFNPATAMMQPQVSVESRPQAPMTSMSITLSRPAAQDHQANIGFDSGSASRVVGMAAIRGSIVFIIERDGLPRITVGRGDFDRPPEMNSHQGWPDQAQHVVPKPAAGPTVMLPTGDEVPTVNEDAAPAGSMRALRAPRSAGQSVQATVQVPLPSVHSENLPLAANAVKLVQEVEATIITIPQAAASKTSAAVSQLQSALLSTMTAHNVAWRPTDALTAAPAAESQAPAPQAAAPGFAQKLAGAVKSVRHFDFASMGDPLALLSDPLAAFVDESISLGKSVASIGVQSSGAWSVTAAVIAADVVLLTYLYRRDQRGRQRRKVQPAWAVGPRVFND
jgi:hypothetical protein